MCFGRHLKNGSHSPNFELKLEIPNIMLVCKFEINWSTNKNLRTLTTYLRRADGLTDGRLAFPYPPLRFAGVEDNYFLENYTVSFHSLTPF